MNLAAEIRLDQRAAPIVFEVIKSIVKQDDLLSIVVDGVLWFRSKVTAYYEQIVLQRDIALIKKIEIKIYRIEKFSL